MAERYGLRRLKVSEPGHERVCVLQRFLRQRALIGGKRLVNGIDAVSDPQPKIGCDLVVSRAPGMKPSRDWADKLSQPVLHVHIDVFERPLELELALLDL